MSSVKSCVISTPGFSRFPNISPRPNRPLPSSPGPLYQNKRWAFDMEMFFHSHASKIHFHNKGCALGLILKVRVFGTRKWPADPALPEKWKKHDSLTTHYRYLCITVRGNDNNNKKENIYPDFWKRYRQMDFFGPTAFFRPKTISKVAIIKTKSATVSFFLFSSFLPPRSFFFSFPFPSLEWFWSWSRTKNLPFDAFSLKMTANFFKLVFKKSARCTSHELSWRFCARRIGY